MFVKAVYQRYVRIRRATDLHFLATLEGPPGNQGSRPPKAKDFHGSGLAES